MRSLLLTFAVSHTSTAVLAYYSNYHATNLQFSTFDKYVCTVYIKTVKVTYFLLFFEEIAQNLGNKKPPVGGFKTALQGWRSVLAKSKCKQCGVI